MPLLEIREFQDARLGLWLIREDAEALARMVPLCDWQLEQFRKLKAEKRKKEVLSVRVLLDLMQGYHEDIEYLESGKPVLPASGRNISITHSQGLAAVLLSPFPCGIDAEESSRDPSQIAGRYLSDEEIAWTSASGDPQAAMLLCWSCKEALYKMSGLQKVNFRTDMILSPVEPGLQGEILATIRQGVMGSVLPVTYFYQAGHLITWCLAKDIPDR